MSLKLSYRDLLHTKRNNVGPEYPRLQLKKFPPDSNPIATSLWSSAVNLQALVTKVFKLVTSKFSQRIEWKSCSGEVAKHMKKKMLFANPQSTMFIVP